MKKSILTIAFLSVVLSTVTAQDNKEEPPRRKAPPTIKELFKDLDTNKDGKISFKEAKWPLKNDFKKVDLNKDGFLSNEEIEKAPKPKHPEKREH